MCASTFELTCGFVAIHGGFMHGFTWDITRRFMWDGWVNLCGIDVGMNVAIIVGTDVGL